MTGASSPPSRANSDKLPDFDGCWDNEEVEGRGECDRDDGFEGLAAATATETRLAELDSDMPTTTAGSGRSTENREKRLI